MATQTTDLSNIARQSDNGVPTFTRPKGQSLMDTLRDYSGLADDVAGTVGSVVDAVKGKPATTPKPPGPVTDAAPINWLKYGLIAGGLIVVAIAAKFFFKK